MYDTYQRIINDSMTGGHTIKGAKVVYSVATIPEYKTDIISPIRASLT